MNLFKKGLALVLTLSLVLVTLMPSFADETTSSEKTIQIISFNDFHGALAPASKDMGYAKMVAAIKAEEATQPNTIVVSAGDNFQGSAMSNMTYGEPVNDMMKAMGVVASAVGNHEFDWGVDKIPGWAEQGGYDFLATNIYDKATGEPVSWAKPYKIVEVDGVKIGLIGIATLETITKTKADNVANLEFKKPSEAAQPWIDYLKAGKAPEGTPDVIVALTHLGAYQDKYGTDSSLPVTGDELEDLCNNTTGLDAVFTGHTHTSVAGYINGVTVVQAYKQGRTLGFLTITMNADGTLKDIVPSLKDSSSYADLTPDADAEQAYGKWQTELGPILDEVLGKANGDYTHDNDTNVSVLGKWTCEAMATATNTQIAFQNGGGLRVPIPSGDITYGLLYEVMPFDNTLVTMDLSGADVLKNVEHGIDLPTAGNGSFSGLKVVYDPSKEYGSKVTSITLADGTPLDPNAYYRVVTNDFMVTGGDGYDFSGAKNVVDTFIPIRDMLVDKVKAEGTITAEPVDYMSVVQPVKEDTVYVVKAGDVLWKIAQKFGLTYQQLGDYNKLTNYNLIFPNQKLLVPAN